MNSVRIMLCNMPVSLKIEDTTSYKSKRGAPNGRRLPFLFWGS